jgi:hypothetical protein
MNFIIQNFSLETVSFFERGETWKEKRDVKQYMTLLILPLFDLHAEQKTKNFVLLISKSECLLLQNVKLVWTSIILKFSVLLYVCNNFVHFAPGAISNSMFSCEHKRLLEF